MSSTSASAGSTSSTNEDAADAPTIALLRQEYQKADRFCQEVQSFLDLAGVPALNELRNAGKHLIDGLTDDGAIGRPADLRAAIAHARRACYEAYEAGILGALEIIGKFRDDYATTPVEGVLPDYTDILVKAQAAQKSVEVGRHPEFERAQDHTTRMKAFQDLRACAERLTLAREEMNKKVSAGASQARMALWGLVFGGLAVALAILIAVWDASGFWVPWGEGPTQVTPG